MKVYHSPSFIVRTSDKDAPKSQAGPSADGAKSTTGPNAAESAETSKLSEMKRRQKRLYDRVSMIIRQKQTGVDPTGA